MQSSTLSYKDHSSHNCTVAQLGSVHLYCSHMLVRNSHTRKEVLHFHIVVLLVLIETQLIHLFLEWLKYS